MARGLYDRQRRVDTSDKSMTAGEQAFNFAECLACGHHSIHPGELQCAVEALLYAESDARIRAKLDTIARLIREYDSADNESGGGVTKLRRR